MVQQKGIITFGIKLAREIADTIFTNSQENLINSGAVDTSNLLLSGTIEEKNNEVIIHYDSPYARAVNDGSKPHGMNSKVLEGWVRRKIRPGSEKKVKSIAFAISQSIRKRGTVPNPFMDKAIEYAKIKFKL